MIKPAQYECPVCLMPCSEAQVFSIGNCGHKFCSNCCLKYIDARLSSFETVKCLTTNCSEKMSKKSPIYTLMTPQSKRKLGKYQQFTLLQNNRDLKPCSNGQCLGTINPHNIRTNLNKNEKFILCNECNVSHCCKCYALSHKTGQTCKLMTKEEKQKQENLMRSLNYRRCPACSIWVEKSGGCQYLVCKCKTEFCFVCGSNFDRDPCRKMRVYQSEQQVRKISKFGHYFKKPNQFCGWLCLVPKSILKFLLTLMFNTFSGLLFMTLIFVFVVPLVYLIAPAGLIVALGQINSLKPCLVFFLRLLTVILYPLVGLVAALVVFLLFLTYPLVRTLYHAHIYDQMDRFMHQISGCYLRAANCILAI